MNELRYRAYGKVKVHQENMKNTFDRKEKGEQFLIDDLVLKCVVPHEDKGKHGKFYHMWMGPYIITTYRGDNAFILQHQDGSQLTGGLVNGRFLKHYLS